MVNRFIENPILTTKDIKPSSPDLIVECVLNPGVFEFAGKTWLLLRVAERPVQQDDRISFPVMEEDGHLKILEFATNDPDLDLSDARMVRYRGITYLSTISHLRLVCSDDGIRFYEPEDLPTKIVGQSALETFGIEDCRVVKIAGEYYLTYTQVSENGVGVGLMQTRDWRTIERKGMILPPHNKDCALFEEKIGGKYHCLHRPSGVDLGGNFIWISSSPDLLNWGGHQCILRTRPGMWDCARVGAGAAPIKTAEGWLEIYHGADFNHRYCLGAVLLDLDDPSKVLARSQAPLFEPETDYETRGFFGNVVFTNGHLVNGDEITMYYGASDEVICGAKFSIGDILNGLK
ncbi:MAG: glycoside hydrolase family 130 protein [Saprospiraceae bacterium]|nr:glycoside hydrolase family 130 protein [Saprospiraceae bacterium]MDZ4705979.1 glycoside hydrolase family 130 protein [Saprospiraceae bacterium]